MNNLGNSIYRKTTTIAFLSQRFRIWSRLGMLFYMYVLYNMVEWVYTLPDITTPQTTIISIIVGLSTPLATFYLKSGKELYSVYANLEYSNSVIAFIDHVGFVIDKFRIFPLIMLAFFGMMVYTSLMWGMDLGSTISMQQAAFLTTLSSASTFIFGFFITTGEVNMKLEEVYAERYNIDVELPSKELDKVVDNYLEDNK